MIYHIVEVWLVFDLHLLAIVLQQGSENLAIRVIVPFVAVVLELNILTLGLSVLTFDDSTIMHTKGSASQLTDAARESLGEVGLGTNGIEAFLIEALQQIEIEFVFQITS